MKAKAKKSASSVRVEEPTHAFKDVKAWDSWLAKNHTTADGMWMRLAKKASGIKSITYPEALEVALCYGWIDGLKRPESETAWLQRFTPRRAKSIWSEINREKALGLIASGRMQPAGLEQVERAKRDGRWDAAYASPKSATMPPDFEKELNRNPKAKAFFETISRTNSYAIMWRIQTAKKPETRARRIATYIEMLEKGDTIH